MTNLMTDDSFERLSPHSIIAEQALLAAMMLDRDARAVAVAAASRSTFFLTDHCIIFDALTALHSRGAQTDAVILRDELKQMNQLDAIGGAAYIAQILSSIPSAAHWPEYLAIVLRLARCRWLNSTGDQLSRLAAQDDAEPIELAREVGRRINIFLAHAASNAPPTDPAAEVADSIDAAIAGRQSCQSFPWPAMSELSQALRPGTLTVIAGGAGDSKSFMLLQALTYWTEKGIAASLFALEEDRAFHLHRVLAQLGRCANMTSPEWINRNATAARGIFGDHAQLVDRVGMNIWDAPRRIPMLSEVGAWIRQRADAGDRIIVVDPITRARVSDRRHQDDEQFVGDVAGIAREHGCSIICVTHPVKNTKGPPSLGDLAGGAAWSRFAQCIMTLVRVEPSKDARCLDYTMGQSYTANINRRLLLLKTRSGPGSGKAIGFQFSGQSLTFHECGQIVREATSSSDPVASTAENAD